MGKKEKPSPVPAPGPFHAPFSALAARLGEVPAAPSATPAPSPASRRPARAPPARAVVRMERAGRGGRTVTVVEKLELGPGELLAWLADLKRSLGCGGVVEGTALVLQGDARERVGSWLEKRGVRKVTVA